MTTKINRNLSKQQKLWARYYISNSFNATQAAIDAGYGRTGASTRGYEFSHNSVVVDYVCTLVNKRNKRLDIKAERVLRRIIEIDELDLIDITGNEGQLLPVDRWPKSWRTSISAVEVAELNGRGVMRKIKLPDKLRNLELLGKHIDVQAWKGDARDSGADSPPPLQISFDSAEPKGDVRTTNANP